jgi:hypothetical protein
MTGKRESEAWWPVSLSAAWPLRGDAGHAADRGLDQSIQDSRHHMDAHPRIKHGTGHG